MIRVCGSQTVRKGFLCRQGVPEDADIGLKLIRAAAQEGCEEAARHFFEGGFSVEVDNQEDIDGVTTMGSHFRERSI